MAFGALHPLTGCAGLWRRVQSSPFSQLKEGEWLKPGNEQWSQASCLQAGWELSAWMDRRVYNTQHSHIPVFTHFALLHLLFCHLLGHPSHVSLGSCSKQGFKSRQSPRASKAFPDKTQRSGKSKHISPALWKAPLGCWVVGRSDQEDAQHPRGVLREEPAAALTNKLREDQGWECSQTGSYKLT